MKKVFYILNLLFLTLVMFGGSVFAATTAPEYYLNEEGQAVEVPEGIQDLTKQTVGNDKPIGSDWYYIGDSWTPTKNIVLASAAEVNIVVVNTPTITLTSTAKIFVPNNGSLSFYGATTQGGTTTTALLTIIGSGDFVIGNNENGETVLQYPTGNFGNITFNSGTYTVKNTKATGMVIGSSTTSGGSISVKQEADVTAYISGGTGESTVVGTSAESTTAGCTVNVSGGELNCLGTYNSNLWTYGIDVGSGTVNISDQGKILTSTNPQKLKLNIGSTGGIYGYATASSTPTSTEGIWNAVVGGGITVPVFDKNDDTIVDTDFLNPLTGTYWNSFTVTSNGNITLGAVDPDGNFSPATFGVGGANSYVENNGTVTINSITQPGQPVIWNNMPGSTLTISEKTGSNTPTLQVFEFNNGNSSYTQQNLSVLNLYGDLNILTSDSPSQIGITNPGLNNYGQVNIYQSGTVSGAVENGSNAPNSPDASITLDGEITGNLTNYNSSSVNVGSIGTVNGQLNNEQDGTVTSENPCYYGNKYTAFVTLKSMNPLDYNSMELPNPIQVMSSFGIPSILFFYTSFESVIASIPFSLNSVLKYFCMNSFQNYGRTYIFCGVGQSRPIPNFFSQRNL